MIPKPVVSDNDFKRSGWCFPWESECVEVAIKKDVIAVRNSNAKHNKLFFTPKEWDAFVKGVKDGQFEAP